MTITAAVRAERTKFGTVRSTPWLAGSAVLSAVLVALLLVASIPVTRGVAIAALAPADVIGAALFGIDAAAIVTMVLGASFAGSEYTTGLAQPTFLMTPRRGRVLVAKAVVVAVVTTAVAAVSAALCTLIGQVMLLAAGLPVAPATGELVRLVAGSALNPVFYGLVGLFAATALRSTGGGVVAALAVLTAPAVLAWIPGLDGLTVVLPAAALHGISGTSDPAAAEYLGAVAAAVSLVAWTVAIGALALWRVRSRDV